MCFMQLTFNDLRDVLLLREVVSEKPYLAEKPDLSWNDIAANLFCIYKEQLPNIDEVRPRSLKERVDQLLQYFRQDEKEKLARSAVNFEHNIYFIMCDRTHKQFWCDSCEDTSIRRSGSEEIINEKLQLLAEINDMERDGVCSRESKKNAKNKGKGKRSQTGSVPGSEEIDARLEAMRKYENS